MWRILSSCQQFSSVGYLNPFYLLSSSFNYYWILAAHSTIFWGLLAWKFQVYSSFNLNNYGCRDICTPTGSVIMCGPLSYKMLCSRVRSARRLLTASRLWHVTRSCSHSEKTADWENFLLQICISIINVEINISLERWGCRGGVVICILGIFPGLLYNYICTNQQADINSYP